MSEQAGWPSVDGTVQSGHVGHLALNVDAGHDFVKGVPPEPVFTTGGLEDFWATSPIGKLTESPAAASAGAPSRLPASVPSGPLLKISLHSIEGALSSSLVAPFVRVHLVDATSGLPWKKSNPQAQAVFNMGADGAPYLRAVPGQREPWHADVSPSASVRPFATKPCQPRRVMAGSPKLPLEWNEEFIVAAELTKDAMFIFEVQEASELLRATTRDGDAPDASCGYSRVAWGFAHIDSALEAPKTRQGGHPLRLQLYKFRAGGPAKPHRGMWSWLNRSSEGDEASEEESTGRPAVFSEFSCACGPDQGSMGFRSTWGRLPLLRQVKHQKGQWPRWTAVLDVTLSKVDLALDLTRIEESFNSEISLSRLNANAADQSARDMGMEVPASGHEGATSAEAGVQQTQGKLAPHHSRHRAQACCVPEDLLWQIDAGKRGASRLSLSPSGRLLAAAMARQGGSSELRVFSIATGQLHAAGAVPHDALVYDLCWHSFGTPQMPTCSPVLISCGGDCNVQVYEIPNEKGAGAGAAVLLQPGIQLHLPSFVYSVSVHPTMSTDPRRLVLVCGGHTFGLVLCELLRQAQGGPNSLEFTSWTLANMHIVDMSKAALSRSPLSPHRSNAAPLSPTAHTREPTHCPDVLCVRFSAQPSTPDNVYASDAAGRVMLFQVRFDASFHMGHGYGSAHASFVRVYNAPSLLGVPIHALQVVTPHLIHGKRLNQIQVTMVDDWVLLYSRDHLVRLCCLQRGAVRVELQMSGLESANYPLRGAMSPDGAYVASGSETGELLLWDARTGKALPKGSVPRVQLAGPVMDVVWSTTHHLLACCALDAQAPPLLLFVGGDPNYKPPPEPEAKANSPLRKVPSPPHPKGDQILTPMSIAPPVAATFPWAMQWLDSNSNPNSVLAHEEKRAMKERILLQVLDQKKGVNEADQQYFTTHIPGGL